MAKPASGDFSRHNAQARRTRLLRSPTRLLCGSLYVLGGAKKREMRNTVETKRFGTIGVFLWARLSVRRGQVRTEGRRTKEERSHEHGAAPMSLLYGPTRQQLASCSAVSCAHLWLGNCHAVTQ